MGRCGILRAEGRFQLVRIPNPFGDEVEKVFT